MSKSNMFQGVSQHRNNAEEIANAIRRVLHLRLPWHKVRISARRTGTSGVTVVITTYTIPGMYAVSDLMHRQFPTAELFRTKYMQGHCPGRPLPGAAFFIPDREVAA